jgi:carbon-monoxide dehydrogenase large subunit
MKSPEQRALPRDRAAFQGEPIVLVVAHSRAIAEDALELITIEWSELPAVAALHAAVAANAIPAHPDSNGSFAWAKKAMARQ